MPEKKTKCVINKTTDPFFTDAFACLLLFHVLFVAGECEDE